MKSLAIFLYILSLIFQVGASYQSFRLISIVKKYKFTCIAISVAITLMIFRQIVPLIDIYEQSIFDVKDAVLSLLISLLLFVGVFGIKSVLSNIQRENLHLAIENSTDQLTMAFTKSETHKKLENEIGRSLRTKHPMAFLMLDIDRFKKINDQYGHLIGDQVLRNLSYFCQHQLRTIDIFGRFGGEEFLIGCPETDKHKAFDIAERLRESIENFWFAKVNGQQIKLTVSIGVSIFNPTIQHDSKVDLIVDQHINDADQAMYQAKKSGRNQTKLFAKNLTS
jgi:diguanylate cyclase (GGDEF)-like protein